MSKDTIYRQDAIDALMVRDKELRNIDWYDKPYAENECRGIDEALAIVSNLPSAQPDYKEVLGWLLAYQTKSFDLHGRYLPHEVISWLINDFTKEFIAER